MLQNDHIRRLFPVLLLNLTAFAIAIPVLPALAYAVGGSAIDVGLLYAVQSLGQFLMAPLWGKMSDRMGRKPILLATFLAAAILELATAFIGSLGLLYAARFLVGLCAGNVATASAMIADSTDDAGRSKGMAIIGISFGIGFTLGPAIGAAAGVVAVPDIAGITGAGLPFGVASAIYFMTFILGAIILLEPALDADSRRANRQQHRSSSVWRQLKRTPVLLLCALFFLYTVSLTVLEGTFFIYMEEVYGYDIVEVGLIFAGMGLLMALFHGAVAPLSKRIGDRRMTLLGVGLLGAGLLMAPVVPVLWFLLTALGIATFGRAIVHPGILAMMSTRSRGSDETGHLMGMLTSASSLGRIFGPAVGGFIFATVSPQAPFYFAGALLLISGLLWWQLWRHLVDTPAH